MRKKYTPFQFVLLICLAILSLAASPTLIAQTEGQPARKEFDPLKDTVPRGVSVSPSSIRFDAKPGASQSKVLRINNDTDVERTFRIASQDYLASDINRDAAESQVPEGYKYGLSKWTFITPSLVTLKPGEKAQINILLDIPSDDENAHAAWSIIIVDEVKERGELNIPNAGDNAMGMGIVPSMGFGIFVYQNPPNMKLTEIELTGYKIDAALQNIYMRAQNEGNGIGFCTYYVELLNMATGETIKVPAQTATILPGTTREFKLQLPALPRGSYNAMGVLDFGSRECVETADIDFAVP